MPGKLKFIHLLAASKRAYVSCPSQGCTHCAAPAPASQPADNRQIDCRLGIESCIICETDAGDGTKLNRALDTLSARNILPVMRPAHDSAPAMPLSPLGSDQPRHWASLPAAYINIRQVLDYQICHLRRRDFTDCLHFEVSRQSAKQQVQTSNVSVV